jgi:hypothetical protein
MYAGRPSARRPTRAAGTPDGIAATATASSTTPWRRRTASRLIRGDRHEPRTEPVGLPEVAELAPGDEPGGGHGLVRKVRVAADDEARLVAAGRLTDDVKSRITEPAREDGRVPQMLATRSSDSRALAEARRGHHHRSTYAA